MNRFCRTELLLGTDAMRRLEAARVVVCGLGAVGSYAAEALARAGIGRLRVVDHDVVDPSNINRQLYALESTVGRPKVEVATARILDINPDCRVEPMRAFIAPDSLAEVLAGSPDVVIDAIDSLNAKVGLLEAAVLGGLQIVSSMGAATRMDPGAVRVGALADTNGCPLARFIRKRLRRRGIDQGVRCVYSVEPPRPWSRSEPAPPDPPAVGVAGRHGRPRATLGSISFLTGIFGLLAAREAISVILGWDSVSGKPSPLTNHVRTGKATSRNDVGR
jgi:tRNA A37 threonylcarbamoyladenosine dehydratase